MDSASPSVKSLSVSRDLEVLAPRVVPNAGASPPSVTQSVGSQAREAQIAQAKIGKVLPSATDGKPSRLPPSDEKTKDGENPPVELTDAEIEESIKAAQEKAKELDNAFARVNAPFKVSFEGSGKEINFLVVEAESGKVIRKFPPPSAQGILDRLNIGEAGALLDESA
jgi:uncharacterized FlaG/YvyC family protein